MTLQDLKQDLLGGKLGDGLIVFVCPDGQFMADSYINEICERKNLGKAYVKSLAETTDSALSLVLDYSNDMSVVRADVFDEAADDYSEFKNCAVICKKIGPGVKDAVADYVVEVPKLQEWQIKAYMAARCQGLTEKAIDWLYGACCHDIYKIDNELGKLSLIDPDGQTDALREICSDPSSDLYIKESVFKLVDALIAGDRKTAYGFLRHAADYGVPYTGSDGKKERDIDPVGLTSLIIAKLRNNLLLNYDSGVSADEIGAGKSAYYIRQRAIPLDRLKRMLSFLSGIDSRLKANPSALDFNGCRKSALLEYVIVNMLAMAY